MKISRSVVALAGLLSAPLWAADDNWQVPNNWQVEGANGVLNISGVLSEGASRDERTGNLSWGRQQPVMTMSFLAPADADNPQLVKVQGVSGIGLRLVDSQQRDVRLGSRGTPQFVSPGDEVLVWYVAAERTRAPLQAGAYRATVNFRLSYE